jgi:hypothetical protein
MFKNSVFTSQKKKPRLHYIDQLVNTAQKNKLNLFWELHGTQVYLSEQNTDF